ncbi:putative Tat pathway signal sequence domain protein [uncultured Eubacteriales bacterium]|uniref:Putative Tat pathway signal sequence domain protein n=1 Tax=uncultured Eubacteriales bacterium TaxID=172733 RepID=A0A212JRQ2_9FIRM|nr:putative Tat pathway signal sequence domain protein [uncultured Eubacteriales bacterium]
MVSSARKLIRGLALGMAALYLAALAGCSRETEGPLETGEPAVKLRILSVGSSGEEACQRIGKALSELTQRELGFSVELQQASMAKYDSELSQQMLLGQAPDLFCYIAPEDLQNYIDEGDVFPLDSHLKDFFYLTRNVPSEVWSCVRVDNQTYAVPANNSVNYSLGFLARADIVEELGIDPSQVTTWDGLHDVLLRVKAAYPDMVPVVPHFGQTHQTLGQDPLGNDLGVLLDNKGTVVENLYASEQYAEMCARMHQWYEEGLILKDASMTGEAASRMVKLYNGFGFFIRLSDNNIVSNTRSVGQEMVAFELGGPIANSSSVNLGWCVSPTSQYKQQAMQLLELLYTNQEAADLCIYGQEGVDYTRIDADTVTNIDTPPQDEWSTIHWGWPNRQVASVWRLPDKETPKLALKGAQRSPAMGFVFNSAPVQSEVDRCKAVADKYHNVLMSGYLDPADALPRFLTELEEAGIETVIAEKQRQLNDWLAAR